jgi:hypothetical protein
MLRTISKDAIGAERLVCDTIETGIGGHVACFNTSRSNQPTDVRFPDAVKVRYNIGLVTWLGQSPFNSVQSVSGMRVMKERLEERLTHARYEYDMAEHCIAELNKPQTQIQWNVLLAGFAVYFRNGQDFLSGKGDQESIKAKHYIKRFNSSSAEELVDELNELHWHVLHLSGKRTSDDEKKLGLEEANKLMTWLKANMSVFAGGLDEPYKTIWKGSGPDTNKVEKRDVVMGLNKITHTSSDIGHFIVVKFPKKD